MSDRKADDEVLRLHTECTVGRHRQYQIDGLAFCLFQDDFGIRKGDSVKPDDALPRCFVELCAPPQSVPDPGRLGIEPDIPGEIDVGRLVSGSISTSTDKRCPIHCAMTLPSAS